MIFLRSFSFILVRGTVDRVQFSFGTASLTMVVVSSTAAAAT